MKISPGFLFLCTFFSFHTFIVQAQAILDTGTIIITPLTVLNSEFRETNLTVSPDGQYLFFVSSRGGQRWSKKRAGSNSFRGQAQYDGDIWFARKEAGVWGSPQVLSQAVNSAKNEDEPNIAPNASEVYFQSWRKWTTESQVGPYFQGRMRGGQWSAIRPIGGGIHQFFRALFERYNRAATDGATFSADGRAFIFAAAVAYNDSMDLYRSSKNSKGVWSYPEKLSINTAGDERSVFLAADGKTLYFASDGYGGAGGLDICKATLGPDGTFGEVRLVGSPFNTAQDDYGMVITASGNEAFFIRAGDIYHADLSSAPDSIKPEATIILSGTLFDTLLQQPIEANILLADTLKKKRIQVQRTRNGEFLFVLTEKGLHYMLYIRSKGFPETKVPVVFNDKDEGSDVRLDVPMTREKTIVDDPNSLIADSDTSLTILFDFDRFELREDARSTLDFVASRICKNPNLALKLIGHTDASGEDTYNLQLSEQRVDEAYRYLIRHGCTNHRILISYFGETRPVGDNQTEGGMQRNRRVEIRFKR